MCGENDRSIKFVLVFSPPNFPRKITFFSYKKKPAYEEKYECPKNKEKKGGTKLRESVGDFARRSAFNIFAELKAVAHCATATITIGRDASFPLVRLFLFFSLSFHRARFYGQTLEKSREFHRRHRTGASRESRRRYVGGFRRIVYEEIRIGVREKMNNLDGSREIRQFSANWCRCFSNERGAEASVILAFCNKSFFSYGNYRGTVEKDRTHRRNIVRITMKQTKKKKKKKKTQNKLVVCTRLSYKLMIPLCRINKSLNRKRIFLRRINLLRPGNPLIAIKFNSLAGER